MKKIINFIHKEDTSSKSKMKGKVVNMLSKNLKSLVAKSLVTIMMFSTFGASIPVKAEGYDSTAPVVDSFVMSSTEYSAGDTITINLHIVEEETGISSCTINAINSSGNTLVIPVEGINGGSSLTGDYVASYTLEDNVVPGEYVINFLRTVDGNGNTSYNESYVYENLTIFNISNDSYVAPEIPEDDNNDIAEVEEEVDLTNLPTIDSVEIVEDTVTIPGVATLKVSGTVLTDATSVSIASRFTNCSTGNSFRYANGTANVEDGKFTAELTVSFDKNCQAVDWEADWVKVTDSTGKENFLIDIFDIITLVNEIDNLYINTSIDNPELVNILTNMDDNGIVLLNPGSSTVLPKEVFEAIYNTNKTVGIDLDGIIWYFNGKDINIDNIKDVDFSTSITDVDATEYGYEYGANAVALVFASNGILPGEAKIKLKSDYIINKFNLNSNLYLAFIKETVEDEVEQEFIDNKDLVIEEPVVEEIESDDLDLDDEIMEEISQINADEESLVKIENAGISFDSDGYITITMDHNSSYVLSDSLPKRSSTVNENNDYSDETETDNQTASSDDINKKDETTKEKEEAKEFVEPESPVAETTKVSVKAPKISKITVKKNKVKVTVKKVSGATKYQIRYSTKKSMNGAKVKTLNSKRSATIKLKRHKKYYIQTRSIVIKDGKKIYSKWTWSSIKSFKTK